MDDNYMNVKYGAMKPGYSMVMHYRGPFDHEVKLVPEDTGLTNKVEFEMNSNK